MDKSNSYQRYDRQMILSNFGEAGQQKLLSAKVLVIGAGGLGCPALHYLTAAGVGTIGIADDDVVALNNLHRQVLFSENDIGFSKAERAAAILTKLNSEIEIIFFNEKLSSQNALQILKRFDIIMDGTDNFSARYMINDACTLLKKTLVYGAISQFEGQISVFRNQQEEDANYRDLFPDPPKETDVLNCAEAGVIGTLPGLIGIMMASETIKLITGIGEPLINQLLIYNLLNNQFNQFSLSKGKQNHSTAPQNEAEFSAINYNWLCATPTPEEIDVQSFNDFINKEDILVIDVRDLYESPIVDEFPTIKIPLNQLANHATEINAGTVITFCQTGKRSIAAANILKNIFGDEKKIYSLKGGILEWKKLKALA